jgi:hypothetical protein
LEEEEGGGGGMMEKAGMAGWSRQGQGEKERFGGRGTRQKDTEEGRF